MNLSGAVLTDHAREQAAERQIDEAALRAVLSAPERGSRCVTAESSRRGWSAITCCGRSSISTATRRRW